MHIVYPQAEEALDRGSVSLPRASGVFDDDPEYPPSDSTDLEPAVGTPSLNLIRHLINLRIQPLRIMITTKIIMEKWKKRIKTKGHHLL